ncbi:MULTISPECIES: hypothetical protein [unclassified Halomonas]|uniref:hypothetical protein n=1 Tax=unclassified Halomonas TaxID=2609666 RepID=UPI002076BB71|nr:MULTISPECIES: hypothetical protein [unclassified Halomonas]
MTDQELLERAARAAGYEIQLYTGEGPFHGCFMRRVVPEPPAPFSKWVPWKPLDDDSDAFRLMVEAGINVEIGLADVNTCAGYFPYYGVTDAYETVRRAIVETVVAHAGG